MKRLGRVGLIGLLLLAGCGTETAAEQAGHPPEVRRTASPTPTPPPRSCPASGAMITVGPVEAALGHRAVVVKLTNCRQSPITLNGYPDAALLNGRHQPLKVTVAHGTSYMAIDPGPSRIRLAKGETALAAVAWSNTIEVAEDKASGTYLTVAPRPGEHQVVWPVDTDLGTTARITLTAWCRKLPN